MENETYRYPYSHFDQPDMENEFSGAVSDTALCDGGKSKDSSLSMEDSEILPGTDADALRGAQGLLASMTILNELEPLENVDDKILGSGDTANPLAIPPDSPSQIGQYGWLNLHSIIEYPSHLSLERRLDEFLSELEPLPTGKVRVFFPSSGIHCDFIPSHREIKNHFQKFFPALDDLIVDRLFEKFIIRNKILLFQEECYVSRKRQWDTLRLLRTEFYSQHRRFLRLASQGSSSLKKFRKYSKGPADLLDTGILTSKDILLGSTPVSLKEVCSLILLSYSMAAVRGPARSFSRSPKKSDFSIWRQCISKEAEKETFDELVSVLWPELNAQLNDPIVPSAGKGASDIDYLALEDLLGFNDLGRSPILSPEIVQASMHDTVSSLFDHTPGDDFDFSVFLNMEAFDEPSATDRLSPPPLLSTLADVNLHSNTVFAADEKANVPEPASVRELVRNIFFLQVIGFLIYLMQLGVLLMNLSGVDRCSLPKAMERSTTVTANFSQYVETAKYRVLNPLRLNPKFSDLGPLLVVPVKLLETGWISSLRDLEEYMIGIARQFSKSREVFQCLTIAILKGCLTAAKDVDYEYTYREDHDDALDYSMEYVQMRQEQEVASFVAPKEIIPDAKPVHVDKASASNSYDANSVTPVSRKRMNEELTESDKKHVRLEDPTQNFETQNVLSDEEEVSTLESRSTPSAQIIQPSACDSCDKVYTGWDGVTNLRRHKREKHEGNSSWSCPFDGCSLVSTRQHNLRQHWFKSHAHAPLPTWLVPTRSKGGGGSSRKKRQILPTAASLPIL